MQVLCFDIGGTDIKYGIVKDEVIIEKHKVQTNAKLPQEELANKLYQLASELLKNYQVDGVGVSCAGSIDIEKGQVITPPEAIPNFKDWNFKSFFKEKFNLDCIADNDVNCFAVAEGTSGAAKDFKNFFTITVGTGIGGAVVVDGHIWRGLNYNAGEVGRMLLPKEKFESLASVTALIKNARDLGLDVHNGKEIFDLYDQDNFLAEQAVASFYHYLAVGIANLIYTFNPEAFVIGGGITNRDAFVSELNQTINRYLVDGFKNTAVLKRAHYKNDGGMMGAYYNFVSRKE